MELKEQITALVEERLASSENFLVEVKVSPGKIVVTVDHPLAVKIEDCAEINRFLHTKLDDSGIFERYELEVGSPGMEEPLRILPQFRKRIGKRVSVVTFDGMKHTGILRSAGEELLEMDEEKTVKNGKKKEIQITLKQIPFKDIKETRVIFSFDKINK